MNDEELENLRKKRIRELQTQSQLQDSIDDQEAQKKEYEEKRKLILRSILTTEARERLGRVKIARPEVAETMENHLIMAATSGQLKNKINDDQLRLLLSKILPKKRDIKIRRR